MNNHKCPKCSFEENQNKIKQRSLNKLNDKYPELDFSKFNYINRDNKSIVICHIHGEFEVSYLNLMKSKNGCKKCYKKQDSEKLGIENIYTPKSRIKSEEEAILELKEKFPHLNFSKFNYINNKIKSIVICPKHGEFETNFNNLYSKNRNCPKCIDRHSSKAEKEIIKFIKTFYDKNVIENDRTIVLNEHTNKYLELDIYLPDINLAIEFNGIYYHSDEMIKSRTNNIFKSAQEYHEYKTNKCNELGIELIHINEQEWIDNKNSVLNSIKNHIINII